jgi:hypothetical protein
MSSFTTVSTAYQLEPQRLLTYLKNKKILKRAQDPERDLEARFQGYC